MPLETAESCLAERNQDNATSGPPGQIGLHGRTGLSDPLGSAASHGCVRFTDASITFLAKRLGAGVPVTIR